MNKRTRQYIGIISAIASYYVIHEGAHLLYALSVGVFKKINFMGLGMQIDIYAERLTQTQLGIFCLVGAVATLIAAYTLVFSANWICKKESMPFRSAMYYITIVMLLLDPIYLGVLYSFFGGGDMNGISLLIPEQIARVIFLVLLVLNGLAFWKVILPKYKHSFRTESSKE